MKQIKFADDKRNGFYADNYKDNIFVSSFGCSHLFNYPSVLVKELDRLSKRINKNKINVYFDLSSVLGENADNKYFVITYDKSQKDFIYPSKYTLEKLPTYYNDDSIDDNNPLMTDIHELETRIGKKRIFDNVTYEKRGRHTRTLKHSSRSKHKRIS